MKLIESLTSLVFFAAKSISTADENSAEENSLRTKQIFSVLKFFIFFFGIKNIFFLLLILFIFTPNISLADDCLKFLPYAYNNNYVHLPEKASFCVKEGNKKIRYSTDSLGGRILSIKKD